MARGRGVLVDGPLAGRHVLVHLFAHRRPMRHLLVFERAPATAGEWVRWRLWDEPPAAGSHRYRVSAEDEEPQPVGDDRAIRYVYDPDGATPGNLPTEIVFSR